MDSKLYLNQRMLVVLSCQLLIPPKWWKHTSPLLSLIHLFILYTPRQSWSSILVNRKDSKSKYKETKSLFLVVGAHCAISRKLSLLVRLCCCGIGMLLQATDSTHKKTNNYAHRLWNCNESWWPLFYHHHHSNSSVPHCPTPSSDV